jgi:Zn-dependent M16 (insulinase) family peptidase
MEGIGFYDFLKNLREKEEEILVKLQKIHSIFLNSQNLTVSTACNEKGFVGQLEKFIAKIPSFDKKNELTAENLRINPFKEIRGLEIPSSVNYAAAVFELRENNPKFIGEVTLLSQVLAKGFLWDKIRVEGGAYGGFCSFNAIGRIFSFGSFRDPNVSKTFDNFTKSLKQNSISQEIIDRALPSQIAHLDTPKSPRVKAVNELRRRLCEYCDDDEQNIRDAIFGADEKSIAKDMEILLEYAKNSQKTLLGSKDAIDFAQKEGLKFKRDKL